ncbi:MAG: twin-arginine translocase subunit TatC [Nitrososphaeraceae archaeon]|jgi:sec-independent protein translocase protein TatC|nr:twin-arginine translocase subunit TatC [Nitrososphaeraceae archaeon]MDW0144253.1 twin-arginine translocase subunit TatC [Nitrososphaeraceae archaeon]MDW0145296.1 twin-arginine translocase subunit TatC [Nitrososphaeraceae archaeon]MDW0148280.1 twin-arginine translocase subunit TatC [Nitrososphaeraceae archaeon]MDW0151594.1 twin-arginine translocase subunit TatC [Nitrososphaeraceae archaeon]
MSTSGMSIAEHFDELRIRLIHIVICIAIITIISMSFGIKTAIIPIALPSQDAGQQQNLTLYYLFPDPFNNIALQLTSFMKDTLLPPEVRLIQTAPGQVFFAQIHISLLIGLICSLPIVIREIFGFISPAFYQTKSNGGFDNRDVRNTNTEDDAAQGNVQQTRKEEGKKSKRSFSKIDLFKIISPMFLLFIFGVVFSYVLVIPLTLEFLYKYGESIGVETLLTVNDFIAFVLQFILAFGIAFQLPVLMYVLSLSGLTDSKFWQRNFRYAIIIITVFGAIITPDGTGVTMWFIALPMIGLYALGIIAIRRKEGKAITV